MLLLNRRDAVNDGLVPTKEKWGWAIWKKGMLKRSLTDFFGGKMKNFMMKTFFKKSWGHYKRHAGGSTKNRSANMWKDGKRPE
jgi:L-lactate dehydrogenase complex protein LldF